MVRQMKKATNTKLFMEVKSLKPLQVEAEFCTEQHRKAITLHQFVRDAMYDVPPLRAAELADRILNLLEITPFEEVVIGARRYSVKDTPTPEEIIRLAEQLRSRISNLMSSADRWLEDRGRRYNQKPARTGKEQG